MRTYETATQTLNTILADPALRPDKVDETISQLSESVANQEELHGAISSATAPAVDEDEIAAELEQLSLDAAGRGDAAKKTHTGGEGPQESAAHPTATPQEASKTAESLPSAPQHAPASRKDDEGETVPA